MDERLHNLLGGAALANLRRRLRARYEKGIALDTYTLTALNAVERRALAGLLGRPTRAAGSMRIRAVLLDEALARAGIAVNLREALEILDGPLEDRKAERAARDRAWSAALSGIAEPRLAHWASSLAGSTLLKRLSDSDPARASTLLMLTERVLRRVPGHGIARAQLAALALGDSHALDNGRPVATLVLRAGAPQPEDSDESPRERWARLGVTVNELASPALYLNLPVVDLGIAPPGEPTHLSLRRLLRRPPPWSVAGRTVFVCENPNFVAIAADRLGARCAPLVCTDGMPAAAQQTLLAQLAAGGARLRYHGDFDWPGIAIGNFVMREFGAEAWRFGALDYLSACGGHGIELGDAEPVAARWDDGLAGAMAEHKAVVHEEAVAEVLLGDLERVAGG